MRAGRFSLLFLFALTLSLSVWPSRSSRRHLLAALITFGCPYSLDRKSRRLSTLGTISVAQAKRLFGLIAAGASLGGLVGPLLAVFFVERLAHAGLLFLSAGLMVIAAFAAHGVQLWRDRHPLIPEADARRDLPPSKADDARRARHSRQRFAGALMCCSRHPCSHRGVVVPLVTASRYRISISPLSGNRIPNAPSAPGVWPIPHGECKALSNHPQLSSRARWRGVSASACAVAVPYCRGRVSDAGIRPLFAVLPS